MTEMQRKALVGGALGVVLVLLVVQFLVLPIFRQRDRLAADIRRSTERLQELTDLERTYLELRKENSLLARRLASRPGGFTLFAFLENLAGRVGLKEEIEFMRPSVKPLDDRHQEEQVEMRLKGISLQDLVPYLYRIETAPEQVRVRRMTIRPQQRQGSLLDVNLVLVTQKLSGSK